MGIVVVRAEIVRHNSAPTRACGGYYEEELRGLSATVEPICASGADGKPIAVHGQNITVAGPSLRAVQEFHSKLSRGRCGRLLVLSASF